MGEFADMSFNEARDLAEDVFYGDDEPRRRTLDLPVSSGAFNDFDEYHFGSAAAPDRGHHQAAGDTMNIKVSWYDGPSRTRQSKTFEVPDHVTPQSVKCEVTRPVREADPDDFDVVRVRFEPGGQEYCYRMDLDDNIRVHDYVLAPPNSYSNKPQVVRVTGFGRNHYRGSIFARVAKLPAGYEPR